MNPITTAVKVPYTLVRLPLDLFEKNVIARRLPDESPLRLGFERALGSLDEVAGRLLGDEELRRRGNALVHRAEFAAKAATLETKAAARREEADAELDGAKKSAAQQRSDAEKAKQDELASAREAKAKDQAKAKQDAAKLEQEAKAEADRRAAAKSREADQEKQAEQKRATEAEKKRTEPAKNKIADAAEQRQEADEARKQADRMGELADAEKAKRQSS